MYEDFNKYVMKISESGMIVLWLHDIEHILKLKFLNRNNMDKHVALSLKQTSPSFIVLLLGLWIAIVVFVAEQIYFKCKIKYDSQINYKISNETGFKRK